jgi:hypothetical protein
MPRKKEKHSYSLIMMFSSPSLSFLRLFIPFDGASMLSNTSRGRRGKKMEKLYELSIDKFTILFMFIFLL